MFAAPKTRSCPGSPLPRLLPPAEDCFDLAMADFRHRSCCLKQRYVSMGAAEAAIQELKAKFQGGYPLHPYYCFFCNDFHLGRAFIRFAGSPLGDLERQLRFDFSSPCHHCGKMLRFGRRGQPASGKGYGKPSAAFMRQTESTPPSTDFATPEAEDDRIPLPLPPSPAV